MSTATDERSGFATAWSHLEAKFDAAAARDKAVYLPNFTPSGPVDAVLVAMEPSPGWWARTETEAKEKIKAGFQNFMWSPEDFILHYAARRFLCSERGTYHLTDVSKGAMLVEEANRDWRVRYERWKPLLEEEVRHVAKRNAHIVAIGGRVCRFLRPTLADRNVTCIMHYGAWAHTRDAAVKGHEDEFRAFADTLSVQDIMNVAAEVLRENSVPETMAAEAIARLPNAPFSESRKKLAFIYKRAFEKLCSDGAEDSRTLL